MMHVKSIKNLVKVQRSITYSVIRSINPTDKISKSPLPEGDVKDMSITGLDPNAVKVFMQELFVKKPEVPPTNLGR